MDVKPDPQRLATWEALIRTIGSLMTTFEKELLDAKDLPLPWYDVLIQLSAAPEGRLRIQSLANSVVLSNSGLTRLLDRMERAGLVRREPSPEDRRGYYAIITDQGSQLYSCAKPIHEQGIHRHFTQYLSEADVRALRAVIKKVRHGNELPDLGAVEEQ